MKRMNSCKEISRTAIILLIMLLFVLYQPEPIAATPPSDISLEYDYDARVLKANVTHFVANVKTHYIELIEIMKNDVFYLNRTYANQSDAYGMYDTFDVQASHDDNLTLVATCKKGQFLASWIMISETTTTTTTTTTTPTGTDQPALGLPLGVVNGIIAAVIIGCVLLVVVFRPDAILEGRRRLRNVVVSIWDAILERLRGLRK